MQHLKQNQTNLQLWNTSACFTSRRQGLLGTINAIRNSAHHRTIIQCHGNNLA